MAKPFFRSEFNDSAKSNGKVAEEKQNVFRVKQNVFPGYAIKLVKSLIHTLRIKNCNIGKLYGNIFTPLTLTVLEIEDTPIKVKLVISDKT